MKLGEDHERIDAHHHLWHYTEHEYGWIDERMMAIRRDFVLADLYEQVKTAHVSGTVVVQARQRVEETEWLLSLAAQEPILRGVVGWLPIGKPEFPRLLERFAANRLLKGLRHVVQAEQPGFLNGNAFNSAIASLRLSGLVYDILVTEAQLQESLDFVNRHPQQSFVLDHIGKPLISAGELQPWAAKIRELGRHTNVACKLSGMVTEANARTWTPEALRPYFDVVLEAFGPSRLMTGTDWPVVTVDCSYSRWWRIVEQWVAKLSASEQADILGGTAIRIYHLS